jgi:hypothetical protein
MDDLQVDGWMDGSFKKTYHDGILLTKRNELDISVSRKQLNKNWF